MNIGNNISDFRKKNNLSQEELAEKVGVSRQTISNWELEESSPDIKQAVILSKIFNISIDELIGKREIESNKKEFDNKITLYSPIENVIVLCDKVQSSSEYKTGKDAPKFALFAIDDNGKNIFLGWYVDQESLTRETKELNSAIRSGEASYELKYNSKVKKSLFRIKIDNNSK